MPHRLDPLRVQCTSSQSKVSQLDVTGVVNQEVLIISGILIWIKELHVPLA